jgi:hypothetical protein
MRFVLLVFPFVDLGVVFLFGWFSSEIFVLAFCSPRPSIFLLWSCAASQIAWLFFDHPEADLFSVSSFISRVKFPRSAVPAAAAQCWPFPLRFSLPLRFSRSASVLCRTRSLRLGKSSFLPLIFPVLAFLPVSRHAGRWIRSPVFDFAITDSCSTFCRIPVWESSVFMDLSPARPFSHSWSSSRRAPIFLLCWPKELGSFFGSCFCLICAGPIWWRWKPVESCGFVLPVWFCYWATVLRSFSNFSSYFHDIFLVMHGRCLIKCMWSCFSRSEERCCVS